MIVGISLAAVAVLFLYLKHPPQQPVRLLLFRQPGIQILFRNIFHPIASFFFPRLEKDGGSEQNDDNNNNGDADAREGLDEKKGGKKWGIEIRLDGMGQVPTVVIPEIRMDGQEESPTSSGSTTPTQSTFGGVESEDGRRTAQSNKERELLNKSSPVLPPLPLAVPTTKKKISGTMPPPPFLPTFGNNGWISEDEGKKKKTTTKDGPTKPLPMFPSMGSAQRVSSTASSSTQSSSSASRVLHLPTAGIYPPSPGMAPGNTLSASLSRQRGGAFPDSPSSSTGSSLSIPARQFSSLSIPANKRVPKERQKVALAPGFSPMDWANRQQSAKARDDLSGVNGKFLKVTPTELKKMNGRKGAPAWTVFRGGVYNMTEYIPYHPGGEPLIRLIAGKDGEEMFNEYHSWVNWENMLNGCWVGTLVEEGGRDGGGDSDGLDEMD